MKLKRKNALTIIEVMVSLLIIIFWLIWIYSIYWRSQKVALSIENRVKAISMAREAIEVVHNIRDTNWLIYQADLDNCWNTNYYNGLCLWNQWENYKITSWSYIVYTDSDTNQWKLDKKSGEENRNFSNENYRQDYKINIDQNWFFTQTWWIEFLPIFTREIKITYPDSNRMKINVKVSWNDNTKIWFSNISLDSEITNWKE